MPEHTVSAFDTELVKLDDELMQMGHLAVAQVSAAVETMVTRDAATAERLIEQDAELDRLDAEIEHQSISLIARRQPIAQDLRRVVAAMRIAHNLERCGDLAKNIAKRTLATAEAEPLVALTTIERMGQLVASRLNDVLEAHNANAVEPALAVWRRDKEVDALYDNAFRELLTYMMADPRTITAAAHLLFVAKNLERIGDHATNIAELVQYRVTGEAVPGSGRPKWDALAKRDEA
jgi:phosphate transport system protein